MRFSQHPMKVIVWKSKNERNKILNRLKSRLIGNTTRNPRLLDKKSWILFKRWSRGLTATSSSSKRSTRFDRHDGLAFIWNEGGHVR